MVQQLTRKLTRKAIIKPFKPLCFALTIYLQGPASKENYLTTDCQFKRPDKQNAPRKCTKRENALRTAVRGDKSEMAPTLLKDLPHDTSELYLSHPTSYPRFGKDREQLCHLRPDCFWNTKCLTQKDFQYLQAVASSTQQEGKIGKILFFVQRTFLFSRTAKLPTVKTD